MGSSKKQTVGYEYYLGNHLGLCHGPIDRIVRLRWDERDAWIGDSAGGTINVNARDLFGGEKREGGISGNLQFDPGHSTQGFNGYLTSQLGGTVPAFRGIAALALNQMYLGNNPYLKKMDVRASRIHTRQDGIAQWYDAKAQIGGMNTVIADACLAFTARNSDGFASFRALASDGSRVVGVGTANFLTYSDDQGDTWTRVAAPWISEARGIAFGAGVWIAAINAATDGIYRSTDGINWTRPTLGFQGAGFNSVIWAGAYFVAVGGAGVVYHGTADGLTWAKRAGNALPSGWPHQALNAVAFNDGVCVIAGQNQFLATVSVASGFDFTIRTSPVTATFNCAAWSPSENMFYVGGTLARGAVSTDGGSTWTALVIGAAPITACLVTGAEFLVLASGTASTTARYYRKSGGIWADCPIPTANSGEVRGFAFAGEKLVFGGTASFVGNATYLEPPATPCADMNPAHIIRECLTDPDWGMGYAEADVDDDSFTAAADTLHAEQMGISLLWDSQSKIEEFIDLIVQHIDAALYVDNVTGKFTLKLIRSDYDVGTIIELGEGEIERVEGYSRPAFGELINQVTVNYWDQATGQTATTTAHDQALQQMQGGAIGTTVQYPGFTNPRCETCGRYPLRYCHAQSMPRAKRRR